MTEPVQAPVTPPVVAPEIAAAPAVPVAAPTPDPTPVEPTPLPAVEIPPPEALKEDTAPKAEKAPAPVFEPTGDAGLDLALEFVSKLGIPADDPAIKAAESGDFTALEEAMKKLGKKAEGYEKFMLLAQQAVTRMAAETQARRQKDWQAIHEAVGGDEAWTAISQWAATQATAQERAEVNAGLALGGRVAVATAKYLADLHQRSSNAALPAKSPIAPGAKGTPPVNAPLTKEQYAAEYAALHRKYRGDPNLDSIPEVAALNQRRLRAKAQGI